LPNPIFQDDGLEICIFTKDPQKEWKELFRSAGVAVKVIGVTKLRKNYKAYDARRTLLGTYDMFLADKRIYPLLPRLLGKKFYESNRIPIPVNIKTDTDLAKLVDSVKSKTHFSFKAGSTFSVRVGKLDQSANEITENICSIAQSLSPLAIEDWNLIQSINIKTPNSVALPIYLSNPIPLISQPESEKSEDTENNDDDENEDENEDEDE